MKLQPSFRSILVCVIIFLFGFPAISFSQNTKEEEKFWKEKASQYGKKPLLLKEDIESFKDTISYWKEMNKSLEQKGGTGLSGGGAGSADSLINVLEQLNKELTDLREERIQMLDAYAAVEKVGELGIQSGLVYRLMVGDASRSNTNNNFSAYVIGSFRTERDANSFVKNLRKIGMSGPISIVAYIDGAKVSMAEARKYRQAR